MQFVAALKIAAPYIATASSVASAFQTLQAGKSQSEMYKLQAAQARLKASRDALQYEQQGNQIFERLLQTNATAAARGFAGGVSGFSGSAKLIQERNERTAGQDINIMQQGAKEAISFGEVQSNMLKSAADQARSSSYFDAFAKLGEAAYFGSKVLPGSDMTSVASIDYNPATNLDTFYKKGIYLNG